MVTWSGENLYHRFGAVVDHDNKTVQFRLFFPDHNLDPSQYITFYQYEYDGKT